MESEKDPDSPSSLARALQQSQMGLTLVAPILGLGGIGWLLDRYFATQPWLTLAGLVLGVVGGMVNFLHAALHPPDGQPPKGSP